jgi:hypothetical protein
VLKKPNRNSGEDDARGPYSWDFAIAWTPGWHVTLFPLGLLTTALAVVVVLAVILTAIWFLL